MLAVNLLHITQISYETESIYRADLHDINNAEALKKEKMK